MLICTSTCTNYLPKAMVLAETLKQCNPRRRFLVCLVEKKAPPEAVDYPHFDAVILAKDLGFPYFGRFISSHTRVEASTAIKGQLFRYLLDHFPQENTFTYLDPDIYVYSDLVELDECLQHEDIVLTPHLLYPGNLDMELSCLNHGIFNLGFLAIRRSEEAERFIDWWRSRLEFACYDDMPHGIFTDQKWVDLAPAFFHTYLLKEPGYNLATWTLMGRKVSREGGQLFANQRPIRFIHFSGFDSNIFFKAVEWWVTTNKKLVISLGEEYRRALLANGQERFGHMPWSYDFLNNGQPMPPKVRRALRDKNLLPRQDPYALSVRQLRRLVVKKQPVSFHPLTLVKRIIKEITS